MDLGAEKRAQRSDKKYGLLAPDSAPAICSEHCAVSVVYNTHTVAYSPSYLKTTANTRHFNKADALLPYFPKLKLKQFEF